MAGENDVVAKLIIEDQTRQGVEAAKKNIKDGTDKINEDVKKTAKVFDLWNFSLNAVKAGMKALNFVAKQNADLQADLNEVYKFTAFFIEDIASAIVRATGAANSLSDAMDTVAEKNLQTEINKSTAALLRMRKETELSEDQWFKLSLVIGGALPNDAAKVGSDAARALREQAEETNRLLMATQELSQMTGMDPRRARAIVESFRKAGADQVKIAEETSKEREKIAKEEAEAIAEINERLAKEARDEWAQTFGGGFSIQAKALEDEFLNLGKIAGRFASETHRTISDGLFSALKGEAITFRDFMTSILDSILRQTTDAAAAALLGSFAGSQPQGGIVGSIFSAFTGNNDPTVNAKGNAYDRQGLIPFARGGVVNSPTTFDFSGGRGLMGEAGPEAIMPLERTSDGRLGVVSEGGGMTVNVNISAVDGASVAALFARGDFRRQFDAEMQRATSTRRRN